MKHVACVALLADLKKVDERYGPYRFVGMVWTIEGEEVDLLWNDPDGPEAV